MNKWMKLFSLALLAVGAMVLFAPRSAYASSSSCMATQCQGFQYECAYWSYGANGTGVCEQWEAVNGAAQCGWNNTTSTCYCPLPSGDGYNGTWAITSNPCPSN